MFKWEFCLIMFEWEAVLFLAFELNVSGRGNVVGGHPVVMVMQEDFFMDLFFFGGGCLGKVTGSKLELVVVKVVVWVVWANFGLLLEVVIWEMVVRVTREVLQWVIEKVLVWVVKGLVRGIVERG